MEKPVISVIIPVYKVEPYLDLCVTTVVHQTYKNLDIILIDDGSPDRCPRMCDDWAAKDNRIRVIHKANSGLSDARNCGLRAAAGEYVAFVDSDDWISLVMLERLEEAIEHYDADMAMCQFTNAYADGVFEKHMQEKYPDELLSARNAVELLLEDARVTSHVWRKLYKRKRIPADCFPAGMYFEDICVMPDLFLNCRKIICLDDAYYFYRDNPNGIVRMKKISAIRDYLKSLYMRDQRIRELLPDLRDKNERAKLCGIFRAWWDLKQSEETGVEKEAFRTALQKEISEIKISLLMQPSPSGYGRMRPDILMVKLCPGLERLLYGFMLSDQSYYMRAYKRVKRICENARQLYRMRREVWGCQKIFWLFCIPEHGNLGDQAILLAEEAFIKHYFSEYRLYKVPFGQMSEGLFQVLAGLVRSGDYCAIQGGGNMGTLYPGIHQYQERMIYALRKKSLFVFPQTFYYSRDGQGEQVLRKTQEIYNKCEHLRLFARESVSYAFLKKHFPATQSVLMPDMVLSLPAFKSSKIRSGALAGIRFDDERTMTDRGYGKLLTVLEKHFSRVEDFDTHVYRNLNSNEAKKEIIRLWERMAGAEVVVTDRLHGMIFAAITQTPCVLLLSKSHKIEGVYQWLKPLPYIRLAHDEQGLEEALQQVMSVEHPVYFVEGLREKFHEMARLIREETV